MKIEVFQIYFDEDSEQHLSTLFTPYFNEIKDSFFENTVISSIHKKDIPCDYIGVTSWRYKEKVFLQDYEILDEIDGKEDVYIYSPPFTFNNTGTILQYGKNINGKGTYDIWERYKQVDSDLYRLAQLVNNAGVLPFDVFKEKWVSSFCNYWIAKKEVFNTYVETVLDPAIAYLQRGEIKKITCNFRMLHRNKQYPIETFFLQGLFGSFLANNKYKVKHIDTLRNLPDKVWYDEGDKVFKTRIKGIIYELQQEGSELLIKEHV